MEYLVMECFLGYAVVLDSRGQFIKVPNLGYEPGQKLDRVVLPSEEKHTQPVSRHLTRWAAMAACLFLVVGGLARYWFAPVGEVRMQINPDVLISVNRMDRVIALDALNDDGETLIEGYRSYGKTMQSVSNELADLSIEYGYLSEGGDITLTVSSDDDDWKLATEDMLLVELDAHLRSQYTITVVEETASEEAAPTPITQQTPYTIVIDPDDILNTPAETQPPAATGEPYSSPGVTAPERDDDEDDDDDIYDDDYDDDVDDDDDDDDGGDDYDDDDFDDDDDDQDDD